MFAEIAHVLRHAPATLALKRRVPQHELYDTLIARADAAGLAGRRADLVEGLRGNVVEIGCGTGAMFAHYRDVTVTAIEPDEEFAARARVAARSASISPERMTSISPERMTSISPERMTSISPERMTSIDRPTIRALRSRASAPSCCRSCR
jgi:SAM-dependent methyltransferase